MLHLFRKLKNSLISKLIFTVGVTLLMGVSAWSYFSIEYQTANLKQAAQDGLERVVTTIRLGTHYAMMINSRPDIQRIVENTSRQRDIRNIRIFNKDGEIKFSNRTAEVGKFVDIDSESCRICHLTSPPRVDVSLDERTRIFSSSRGVRFMGLTSPIYNEPGCSADPCHVHPEDKQVLGILDVVVSLEATDKSLATFKGRSFAMAGFIFLATSGIIFVFLNRFVRRPIMKLVEGTYLIAKGGQFDRRGVDQDDEIGHLAIAINQMGREISEKQVELNRQRDEYRALFEGVPCIITVQDRNFRLLSYNKEFADRFDPKPGDYCYHAYKGRDDKCPNCPLEKTFSHGVSCCSEESGVNKDGSEAHWIVTTSPLRNEEGEIVAAMEMSIDITPRKKLEEKLALSERNYHAIFNNIPSAVFVLDKESLNILDCNESAQVIYGYTREEFQEMTFMSLFSEPEPGLFEQRIRSMKDINQVRHLDRDGRGLFVALRVSPSEYSGRTVLLVTSSDITKRLEAEQHLIQASKMATLGEMATGVAHELNQPLSVIKTASSYLRRKVGKGEEIRRDILETMTTEIDSHVDRATKIISHMRAFGRKSDMVLEKVQVNDILRRAFEIFSQQLKLREIEVIWRLEEGLPEIMADPQHLEQVFINLLINARDAIEDKLEKGAEDKTKRIVLKTSSRGNRVNVRVSDSGTGIPKAIKDKIFEPFFTTKKVGKGTGLGLSISYGLVKDCGGSIRAVSRKGRGATFVLSFPILDEA